MKLLHKEANTYSFPIREKEREGVQLVSSPSSHQLPSSLLRCSFRFMFRRLSLSHSIRSPPPNSTTPRHPPLLRRVSSRDKDSCCLSPGRCWRGRLGWIGIGGGWEDALSFWRSEGSVVRVPDARGSSVDESYGDLREPKNEERVNRERGRGGERGGRRDEQVHSCLSPSTWRGCLLRPKPDLSRE